MLKSALLSTNILFNALISTLTLVLNVNVLNACTTIFANQKGPTQVVARTMDLYMDDKPILVVSPRGVDRMGGQVANALHWTSTYGNVVVREFHSLAVSDGINEVGLSAHLLYLTGTVYEGHYSEKPGISNALWVQYLLDNCKTVTEALQAMQSIQIVSDKVADREWPLHLNVQDATGDTAIIEFDKGKMNIYHNRQDTIMTNEPVYPLQLKNLKKYRGFGGNLPIPGESDPLSRFVRATTYLKTLPVAKTQQEAIFNALSVIRTTSVPFGAVESNNQETVDAWTTRWITLADLSNKIYYFNSTTTANIIWLDLSQLNFTRNAPVLFINPNKQEWVGEVSNHLQPLNKAVPSSI